LDAPDVASPPPPPQAQPPRQKILPDQLWQGEMGDLLRAVGMSPDDEANQAPSWEEVDARVARDKAAHEAKWKQVNADVAAKTKGGSVRPFFLIPESCWNGELGHFLLMRLKLSPYADWNVAFLPADERTAAAMDLPIHPNRDIPEILAAAETFVRHALARMNAAMAEADRTHEFARFKEEQDDVTDSVRAFAVHVLKQLDVLKGSGHD
jgi:hypothetical protein